MKPPFTKLLVPPHLEYLALDNELVVQETSQKVQRFGEPPEEVLQGNDVRIPFPELIGTEEILIDILEGRQDNFELKAIGRVLADNSPLYFDIYITKFTEAESDSQLIIFFEDVTDRMGLEQTLVQATNEMNILLSALAATNSYVEKIISSMAEALLVTTASGKIKKINQAAIDLFGYSETELVSQPIDAIVFEGASLQAIGQQLQLSQANTEVICRAKTGEKLTVEFSCTAIPVDFNNLAQPITVRDFLYVGRDITDIQQARKRKAVQYATTRILSTSETIIQALTAILPE
ncbi:MAG: PAS domain-containing protein, partial [Microcoleus sp.]